jgi:hypothetical protein
LLTFFNTNHKAAILKIKNKIKELFIGYGQVKDHVPGLLKDINHPDKLCLFFSIKSQQDLYKIDNLLKSIELSSKNLMAFVLNRAEKLADVITNKSIFCFELNDFSLFGKKNEFIQKAYLENHFDLLISFADTRDLVNRKLVSEIDSAFKIGPENPDDNVVFDLIIDYDDTTDYAGYYKQVMHYLSVLNITTK